MKRTRSNRTLARQAVTAASLTLGTLLIGDSMGAAAARPQELNFDLVVAAAAQACLSNAHARATVRNVSGGNQRMDVSVDGLPPNTEFAVFVLQVRLGLLGCPGIRAIS
jgi:hypothetical protein